jgi:hypothetical protein
MKWLVQNGILVKLDMGAKQLYGGFRTKIPDKKTMIFVVFLYVQNFIDKVLWKLIFFNPFVKL